MHIARRPEYVFDAGRIKKKLIKEVRNLKDCLFSVIVDGILENTHPVGCINTNRLHPEETRER